MFPKKIIRYFLQAREAIATWCSFLFTPAIISMNNLKLLYQMPFDILPAQLSSS
jgi:hypothetical protein